jgi:hypothetical protein
MDIRCFCCTTLINIILVGWCFVGDMSATCILHMQWYAGSLWSPNPGKWLSTLGQNGWCLWSSTFSHLETVIVEALVPLGYSYTTAMVPYHMSFDDAWLHRFKIWCASLWWSFHSIIHWDGTPLCILFYDQVWTMQVFREGLCFNNYCTSTGDLGDTVITPKCRGSPQYNSISIWVSNPRGAEGKLSIL